MGRSAQIIWVAPNVITGVLISGKGRQKRESQRGQHGKDSLTLLALKMEEGTKSQGKTDNLWKVEKTRKWIFSRASRRNADLPTF